MAKLGTYIRKAPPITAVRMKEFNSMDAETALLSAIEYIERSGVPDAEEVLKALEAMVNQRGCEHFDPACTDGKLTHLIDIIING